MYYNSSYTKGHFIYFNTLSLKQNGHHFADDIFKFKIFSNENVCILIQIWKKFFLSIQLAVSHHWSYNGLAPFQRQAIIWTNDGLVYWCLYTSANLNGWRGLHCKISSTIHNIIQNDTRIFCVDSRVAPSQWETSLQSNAVSHWLGATLESALYFFSNFFLKEFKYLHVAGQNRTRKPPPHPDA